MNDSETHDNTTRAGNPNAMQTYRELGKRGAECNRLRARLKTARAALREIATAEAEEQVHGVSIGLIAQLALDEIGGGDA